MTTGCKQCDEEQKLKDDKTALCKQCTIEEMAARHWAMRQRMKRAIEIRKYDLESEDENEHKGPETE